MTEVLFIPVFIPPFIKQIKKKYFAAPQMLEEAPSAGNFWDLEDSLRFVPDYSWVFQYS